MGCRPPRGGRGLKYFTNFAGIGLSKSPPSRGAWIEMLRNLFHILNLGFDVAPLAGGVD